MVGITFMVFITFMGDTVQYFSSAALALNYTKFQSFIGSANMAYVGHYTILSANMVSARNFGGRFSLVYFGRRF